MLWQPEMSRHNAAASGQFAVAWATRWWATLKIHQFILLSLMWQLASLLACRRKCRGRTGELPGATSPAVKNRTYFKENIEKRATTQK